MLMNFGTVLSIAAAAFGFFGLVSALITLRAIRGWRARCRSFESTLAAVQRELEFVASISSRTGRQGKRREHELLGLTRQWVESR